MAGKSRQGSVKRNPAGPVVADVADKAFSAAFSAAMRANPPSSNEWFAIAVPSGKRVDGWIGPRGGKTARMAGFVKLEGNRRPIWTYLKENKHGHWSESNWSFRDDEPWQPIAPAKTAASFPVEKSGQQRMFNPSSGARQRARGTRERTTADRIAAVTGGNVLGDGHEQALRWAANLRKEVKNKTYSSEYSAADSHAAMLRAAARKRPRLPNPAHALDPWIRFTDAGSGTLQWEGPFSKWKAGNEKDVVAAVRRMKVGEVQIFGQGDQIEKLAQRARNPRAKLDRRKVFEAEYRAARKRSIQPQTATGGRGPRDEKTRSALLGSAGVFGGLSKSSIHSRYLADAAKERQRGSAALRGESNEPYAGKRLDIQEDHAFALKMAARNRPRLPNPAVQVKVRLFDNAALHALGWREDINMFKLPVVKTGSMPQVNAWARAKGLKFRQDQSIYGGYYVDSEGDSYFLT